MLKESDLTKKSLNYQKSIRVVFTLLGFVFLLGWTEAVAKDNSKDVLEESLESMSLEELLGVKTKTATKVEQSIQEAPATIEVLKREELIDLGVENLYQALSYLPGVEIVETYNGYTDVVIRGVVPAHYNNKVLLMVDGHPLEEPFTGSFYLKSIPISAIKRIEVIRGPASVLYGTNAFAGVINVVTRKKIKKGTFEGMARYGMYNVKSARLFMGSNLGKDGYFFAAAGARYGDNYDMQVDADIEGDSKDIPYTDNFGNLMFKLGYKDLSAKLFGYSLQKAKYGNNAAVSASGLAEQAGLGFDIHYDGKPLKNLEVSAQYWFDLHKRTELIPYPFLRYVQGTSKLNPVAQKNLYARYMGVKHGTDVFVNYKPIKGLNLMSGLTFEYWSYQDLNSKNAPDGLHLSQKDYYWIDVVQPYAQIIYNIGKFSLSAGVRGDRNGVTGWSVIPRAGVVWQPTSKVYLKLLYGQAYRAPSLFELVGYIPHVLKGNPDLNAEKVHTGEFTVDVKLAHHEITADTFVLTTVDEIHQVAKEVVQNNQVIASKTYANAKGIMAVGGSVESTGTLYNGHGLKLDYRINLSGKWVKDRYKNRTADFFAPFTANAGLEGRYKGFSFMPWVEFVSPRKGYHLINIKGPSVYSSQEDTIPAYVLVNLRLSYRPLKWLEFGVVGYNLANQDVEYPDLTINLSKNLLNGYFDGSKRSIITIQGQPITVLGELRIWL